MPLMVPPAFPHDLEKKPRLAGEALVYAALAAGLDDGWRVFYDRRIPGSRRRVDFVCIHGARGVLAVEVKGGQVHDRRGSFRQLVRLPGQRRRIDPFGQLKLALRDLYAAAEMPPDALPQHQTIWFPQMGQGGLRWQPSPHILTRESLAPAAVREAVDQALPVVGGVIVHGLSARLGAVLGR